MGLRRVWMSRSIEVADLHNPAEEGPIGNTETSLVNVFSSNSYLLKGV